MYPGIVPTWNVKWSHKCDSSAPKIDLTSSHETILHTNRMRTKVVPKYAMLACLWRYKSSVFSKMSPRASPKRSVESLEPQIIKVEPQRIPWRPHVGPCQHQGSAKQFPSHPKRTLGGSQMTQDRSQGGRGGPKGSEMVTPKRAKGSPCEKNIQL